MKKKKLIPFAFLGSLIIIVIFIFGVQYGKKVAEVDKTIHFLISITPTRAISPTPQPAIIYNTYMNEDCGIEFLYPSTLKKDSESSTSALLLGKNRERIEYTCLKNASLKVDQAKSATASVMINDKKIEASKSGEIYTFQILNKKREAIQFSISSSLMALLEKTLKVTK